MNSAALFCVIRLKYRTDCGIIDNEANVRGQPQKIGIYGGFGMNDVISLIQQKFGDLCRLCPPLDEEQYPLAEKMLPATLFEVLKISNGVLELMSLPNVDDGKPFDIGFIIDNFEGMCSGSKEFNELYGIEGLAFAGNGAGGFYVMNPDGKIYLYECVGEDGECYADNIAEYISKSAEYISKL